MEGEVLKKQAAAVDGRGSVRQFYEGDTVWAMNFAGCPKWMPGVLQRWLGPVSFTVGLVDGRLWKRHIDHLRLWRPDEDSIPAREQREAELPWLPSDAKRSLGHPGAVAPTGVTVDSGKTVVPPSGPAKLFPTTVTGREAVAPATTTTSHTPSGPAKGFPTTAAAAAAAGRKAVTPAATKTNHPPIEPSANRSPGRMSTIQARGDSAALQPDVTGTWSYG